MRAEQELSKELLGYFNRTDERGLRQKRGWHLSLAPRVFFGASMSDYARLFSNIASMRLQARSA